jgi:hypothetical protein
VTCFASRAERRRPLPVDARIREPIFTSTHAITIDAPPERVWPWVAQMGADPIPGGRTRLIVRGRASGHWLDLARAQPPAGHHRVFIERAYAALAMLPRPLLITFATAGHRIMEARHLRGIQRRSTASAEPGSTLERWRRVLLSCGVLASILYVAMTLFVGLLWDGHSVASNVPSELAAIGAPTRTLWNLLGVVYDDLNEFNRLTNRGHALAEWFAHEFGSTLCRDITRCDFTKAEEVERYVANGCVRRCRSIAAAVARKVDDRCHS